MMKVSNAFTLGRLLFAPIFAVLFFVPHFLSSPVLLVASGYVMLPLLALAEFTDFWDGFFARKFKEVGDFGKIFDPTADVILHLTTFFCYVISGKMFVFVFLLIFYREFIMLFVRCVVAKRGTAIAARKGGKLKTVFYVATSFVCLFCETAQRLALLDSYMAVLLFVAKMMGVICVALSYISFIDYLLTFGSLLKGVKGE